MAITRRQAAAAAAGHPIVPPSPVARKSRARAPEASKPATSKAVKFKVAKPKATKTKSTKTSSKTSKLVRQLSPSPPPSPSSSDTAHKPDNRPPAARSEMLQIIDLYRANPEFWIQNQRLIKQKETNALLALLAFEHGETFTRFVLFNMLPLELRTMIWEYTAREERVVEISYDHTIDYGRLLSKTLVPGIMHACRESRHVGLKIYDSISFNDTALYQSVLRTTFINWTTNFVMLASEEAMGHWFSFGRRSTSPSCAISKQVLNLAIPVTLYEAFKTNIRASVYFENVALVVAVQKIDSEKSTTGNLTFTKLMSPDENTKDIMQKISGLMYAHKNLKLIGAMAAARERGSPMGDIIAGKKSDRPVEKTVEKEIGGGLQKRLYRGVDDGFDDEFEDEFEGCSEQSFGEVTEDEQQNPDELLAREMQTRLDRGEDVSDMFD